MKKPGEAHRVLIVSKHGMLIDVVSVFLEGMYESVIEVVDTSRKVEQLFEKGLDKGLDLLLIEDERILQSAGRSHSDFTAKTILVGNEAPQKKAGGRHVAFIKKPLDLDRLVEAIKAFADLQGAGKGIEYCRIRFDSLLLAGRTFGQDVYVKRGDTYELVIHAGEDFTPSNPKHFELRKQRFLFMKFADFSNFLSSFTRQLQTLSSAPGGVVDVGVSAKLTSSLHEMLYQVLPELGFTPELQEATKASMDMAVSAIKKDTRLADLFAVLAGRDSEYLTWHSVALCSISCRISSLMTWDSANTHYKLSLASFLHDITVQNKDLARVRTILELNAVAASEADKDSFLEHPHAAAAFAREMRDFPGDVDHILAQHHELPNGKGFPLGITHTKISPLASAFIIAHEITDELYDKREMFSLKDSIKRLEPIYNQGYFRRVLEALSQLAKAEGGL